MPTEPLSFISTYVSAFETLTPGSVEPYFCLPCTFISPQGTIVASDEATTHAVVSHLMEQARIQGYHHTEIFNASSTRLADSLALLQGSFIRYNIASVVILRFGFTYILRLQDDVWRIAMAAAHDPVTMIE